MEKLIILQVNKLTYLITPTCPKESRPTPHRFSQPLLQCSQAAESQTLSFWNKFYPLAVLPHMGYISFPSRYICIHNFLPSKWSPVTVLRHALNLTCVLSLAWKNTPPHHQEASRKKQKSKHSQRRCVSIHSYHQTFIEAQKWWLSSITFVYVCFVFLFFLVKS